MRLFLAVRLSDEVRKYISSLACHFLGRIKFVERENLHITLHFLGDVGDASAILGNLRLIRFKPFPVSLAEIGMFPNEKSPRVIHVKLNGADRLKELNSIILKGLGLKNDKPFSPHITIGRVKSMHRFSKPELKQLSFLIDSFHLMKSILTSDGPVYDEVEKFEINI